MGDTTQPIKEGKTAMNENQFPAAVDKLLGGLNSVLTSKTVVGDPIYVKDTIILPLMDREQRKHR